ncbi:type VI secretion system tip protein VgrG [Polluticoccus soli]|uniref:type VI secretion system tip protein VgrG n=1 Tax=Polluticoccus soli TaxID=3034150 RepID=UPI0023E25FF8|nr:type VI secretion system tip protein VgrG [Flavipsychrobacter sp. JY13-12]
MPEDNNRLVPTPANSDLPTATILLNGEAIPSTYQVMAVTVSKGVNRISEAEIIFLDGDVSAETFPLSDKPDFIPGAVLEIHAGYHQQEETIFKGTIVKHAIKVIENDTPVLIITLKHDCFKMALTRNSRLFPDSTDSDAISTILDEYSQKKEVEDTTVTHEHLVQYNSTDWDFAVMRAEMNGLVVINENEKLTVKKPDLSGDATLELHYGSSILEVEAELDARTSFKEWKVKTWNPADQELAEEEGTSSLAEDGNLSVSDVSGAIGDPELKINIPNQLESAEAKAIADAKAARTKLSKIKGRARCIGFAAIQPGDIIGLNGIGERFNGKAFVSGVRHFITHGKWETDIQFGMSFTTHAERFNDVADRPAGGLLPAVNGLQIGIVAQLKDDPKGEDRILLKIPGVSETDEAVWARVASLDAGKERGSFFRPEIGDEVVVGFLNDDPRNAIVLGMLNSSKLPAPLPGSDDNHQKGFVTREKMKLLFDDEKKSITIETPAGNKIIISDDEKGIKLEDENGNKMQMNTDGIIMESAKDVQIKATADIKIEGVNVEIKASANLKGEGSAGAAFKSSAITEIKGSMVNIN